MAAAPVEVILDENFPDRVVEVASDCLPAARIRSIHDAASELTDRVDDHVVISGLAKKGAQIFVTNDHHMLLVPPVVLAIERTRMTVVTLEATGDDEMRAIGGLLLWLPDVIAVYDPTAAQVFRWKPPARKQWMKPLELFNDIATRTDSTIERVRRDAARVLDGR